MLFEEPGEFSCDVCLFAALQFQEHVLLAGEVEEEGSVCHACGGHDRGHIGADHAGALELGDRRAEDALPRLQPSGFARRGLDLRRHGLLFVTQLLTRVNESSH